MDGSTINGSAVSNGSGSANGVNKAEKFEDEKRRIVESCFSKKDPDGSLAESYITHIRILEDGAYQSSPPPPNASTDQKKPRVIIVAVRKSGRVRMHKARENGNGSFSIGKTWPLDDLTAIESFSGSAPTTPEGELRKQWAGGVGFIATIGKPYYWQANTPKEKQFFIGSLVKIYMKYTGGKAPELIGFDDQERDQLLGRASAQARPPALNKPGLPSQPPRLVPRQRPPGQEQKSPYEAVTSDTTARPSTSNSRMQLPREDLETEPSTSRSVGQQQAPQRLRKLTGDSQNQEGTTTRDGGLPPRSRGGLNGTANVPGRFPDRTVTPVSQRTLTPDNTGVPRQATPVDDLPGAGDAPQERRRPPLQISSDRSLSHEASSDNMIPAPLATPSSQREFVRPPARSTDRPEAPQPLRVISPSSTSFGAQGDRPGISTMKPLDVTKDSKITEPAHPTQPIEESSQAPSTEAAGEVPKEPLEDERPGLGPMIKKKSRADVASAFRKAANAANVANSFKPRAGGAAEKLREQQAKSPEGPDGITGVVPAPIKTRSVSNDSSQRKPSDHLVSEEAIPPIADGPLPEVKITSAPTDKPDDAEKTPPKSISKQATPQKKPRETKRPKPTEETQKQLSSLGIESSILDDKGATFATLLDDFGWMGDGIHTKSIDQMNDEIDRELNQAQIGGWLSRFEEEDDRIDAIRRGLDVSIAECEELDGLLTLYGVELGTLNEDIAYIEAQSQGLQVQAANQKLLQAELNALLKTVSISLSQLQPLKESSLESPQGLDQIEKALVLLFKAMITIDPTLSSLSSSRASEDDSSRSDRFGRFENSDISSMRVLQEKKEMYKTESTLFLRRLKQFLQVKFAAAFDECKKGLERQKESALNRRTGKNKLDPKSHDMTRNILWKYSPLMLFLREIDRIEWEEFMKIYVSASRPIYQEEARDAVVAWQRNAKKSTGDEHEILFSSQVEKQTEGIATTARKLTVKRSQTLAKSLRSPLGDSGSRAPADKSQDGRIHRYEVINNILDETLPFIIAEQNFVVDFFHISSFETQDFVEAVSSVPADARHGGDLKKLKLMDPNRDFARKVLSSMQDEYSFFTSDMQQLVEWAIRDDPLQGVGVIAVIERKLVDIEESNQEFLARSLQKIHSGLAGLFVKFLDEQIRAIEDTKVKIKRRKGVIGFIRIFPLFSAIIENMLVSADDLDIRETVNNAYNRINKTMFESLKVIARDNTGIMETGAGSENKEELNHQILLIENMNHYLEEVDPRRNHVLEDWKEKAGQEFDEHLGKYVTAVMSRPLKQLLLFLDTIETTILTLPQGSPPSTIAQNSRQSRIAFQQVLAEHDSKYIRNGIVALKKRVEKHFGDADDPGLSRALVAKVLEACENYFEDVENRVRAISTDVYDGVPAVEWTKNDISSTFR
ncbi:hypothetical protein V493_06710 [Pseudogymnoascus sp. VKM F-4281 (FW-2241)]|nr:hypothetical protein V493_06710 [Pseudogymnoascus sp. VKM F-4281 (FW-2241)]